MHHMIQIPKMINSQNQYFEGLTPLEALCGIWSCATYDSFVMMGHISKTLEYINIMVWS